MPNSRKQPQNRATRAENISGKCDQYLVGTFQAQYASYFRSNWLIFHWEYWLDYSYVCCSHFRIHQICQFVEKRPHTIHKWPVTLLTHRANVVWSAYPIRSLYESFLFYVKIFLSLTLTLFVSRWLTLGFFCLNRLVFRFNFLNKK